MAKKTTTTRETASGNDHAAEKGDDVGLKCPRCACRHFYTVNTKRLRGWIRRRKVCRNCGRKIRTRERLDP